MSDNPTPDLLAALSDFQKSTISAHKDSRGYGYTYASELSIAKALAPAKAEGLLHTFTCKPLAASEADHAGCTEVTLRVFHAASGGFLSSSMLVADYDPANKKDAKHQQRGSGISYARRYLLTAMFGLACDENEGETIEAPQPEPQQKAVKAKPSSNPPKQAKQPAKPAVPAVPAIPARLAKCKEALNSIYKGGDTGVVDLWQMAVKLQFESITADKPSIANLSTEEHATWCEKWLTDYKKSAAVQA